MGLVDEFHHYGIKTFSPTQKAAQIETSKIFAKKIMLQAGIPTASFSEVRNLKEVEGISEKYLKGSSSVVIKADGLAGGKGVFICKNKKEVSDACVVLNKNFSQACGRIVVEEYLQGRECSYFAFVNGTKYESLGFAVDFKRLKEQDLGPNTGGMGGYTPVPWLPSGAEKTVCSRILEPLLATMEKIPGSSYCGFLYCGLMWTESGPKVIEFNARLGDPEAQLLAFADQRDWLEIILSTLEKGNKKSYNSSQNLLNTVGIVMASDCYPYGEKKISSVSPSIEKEVFIPTRDSIVFSASVSEKNKKFYPGRGRVFTVVGSDCLSHLQAKSIAKEKVMQLEKIWPGCQWRGDIASKIC